MVVLERKWLKTFGVVFAFLVLVSGSLYIFTMPRGDLAPSETRTGVSDTEITLGSSLALSGPVAFLGREYLKGAQAYWSDVNQAGGIYDRKIKIVAYDDMYNPPRAITNTQKLINEDNAFALFNYVGTPTGAKALPLINEENIPLVGLFSGARLFRQSDLNKNIFNIRATYAEEAEAFISGAVDEKGLTKIAIFYQYDDYGFDGLSGAESSLAKRNLKPVVTASYQRGTVDVESALTSIQSSGAEAVVMFGTYGPCVKFIKLARASGYNPLFYNVSFVGSEALLTELGKDGDGVVVTEVVPPLDENLPIISEYKKSFSRYAPNDDFSFGSLEGYINAKVISEAIASSGHDLTREKFVKSLESLTDYDAGLGINLSFGTDNHQALHKVYPTYIWDGKFIPITDWKQVK